MNILFGIIGIIGFNLAIVVISRLVRSSRKIKLDTTKTALSDYKSLVSHAAQITSQINSQTQELDQVTDYNNTKVDEREFETLRKMITHLKDSHASLVEIKDKLYQQALPVIRERERAAEILRKQRAAQEAKERAEAAERQRIADEKAAIQRKKDEAERRRRREQQDREDEEERSRRSYSSSSSSDYSSSSSSSSSDNSSYDGGGGSSSGGGSEGSW